MAYFSKGSDLTNALNALPASVKGNYLAFDALYYQQTYLTGYTGQLSPIEHFVQIGAKQGNRPNNNFDPVYYKQQYSDLQKGDLDGADLLYHYVRYGLSEGRAGNAYLASQDWKAYLNANPDVQAYVAANLSSFQGSMSNGAIAHYVKFGALEGRVIPSGSVGSVFTLTESIKAAVPEVPAVTAVYWGYNPNGTSDDNSTEGPADGGIPVKDLVDFLKTITGLDLFELGLVDDDGSGPFDNVTNLSLSMGAVTLGGSATGTGNTTNTNQTGTLTIAFADGTSKNAEVELGQAYLMALDKVLFDSEGNSRLFEKVITPAKGAVAASLQPIKITPTENNGGTLEVGYTGSGNDTIVAGRLELLHQAYIDGGAGRNVLEIDAKGTYAQPAAVLRVQEIRVTDYPNWYTSSYGLGDGNLGNTLFTGTPNQNGTADLTYDSVGNNPSAKSGSVPAPTTDVPSTKFPEPTGTGSDNSWIDLSRALNIEKLVVTDQGIGASGDLASGDLNVVGVRNGAILRLEGAFTSGKTTVQYGAGQTGTLNVELALGDVDAGADINILQNASTVMIDSQGVENHLHEFFAGGSVSRMMIKGAGAFAVEESLHTSFNANNPVIIDAKENTGGLNINFTAQPENHASAATASPTYFQSVKVIGTATDDEIQVNGVNVPNGANARRGTVTIDAGNGANTVVADSNDIVSVTTGSGNDVISASVATRSATVSAGDGNNVVNADGVATTSSVSVTTGSGNDTISVQNVSTGSATVVAGDGNNSVTATGSKTVNVTAGIGNDTVRTVSGSDVVTIVAGDGSNVIAVTGNEISITAGSGNDRVTLVGANTAFEQGDQSTGDNDNYPLNSAFGQASAPGALLTLDLGAGVNRLSLGGDLNGDGDVVDTNEGIGITALEGSVITGSGISLTVFRNSDLTEASLSGASFSAVSLRQELRITDDQFTAIGADKFVAVRDEEGATEDLYLVVNTDTSLSSILAGKALSSSVRLNVELHDGAKLTVTAEQLHKHFSIGGIDGADGLNGKVVITDAGLNFDPFTTVSSYLAVDGGTMTGGSLAATSDVTVIRSVSGFERPVPATSTDTLTINTEDGSNVDALKAIVSEVDTLKIVGSKDAVFTKAVDLGRDAAAALLSDGVTKGDSTGETDAFTIDFSALTGKAVGLTVANFQDVKAIKGNGTSEAPVRIDVQIAGGEQVGASGNNKGLSSSGVQTYVVTAVGDDSVGEDAAASSATFYVCDLTKGVTTLGLRGNHNDTINFLQVNWGTNFLLESGGLAKADGNPSFANVGNLNAAYFWTGAEPHANALVTIKNLDPVATARPVMTGAIDIDNADSITIDADTASAVTIAGLSGNSLESIVFFADGDLTLRGDLAAANIDSKGLGTLSAAGVAGTFTMVLSSTGTPTTNLSNATVSGVDRIVFAADAGLTLSAAQALSIGATNITSATSSVISTLNVSHVDGAAIDLTTFGAKNIGTVTISDAVGTRGVTLNDATVLGNGVKAAQKIIISAAKDDTTLELSAAQFDQLSGAGTVTATHGTNAATGGTYKANLVVTGLAGSTRLDLSSVDTTTAAASTESKVDAITVRVNGVTANDDDALTSANEQMSISGATGITLDAASGVNDLTKASLAGISKVALGAGATLTITAGQLAAINVTDANSDGIADNWSAAAGAKLNIIGVDNAFNVNLNAIQAAGVDIGTLTLKNYDTATTVALHASATLGGADAIVTPTKGGLSKSEPTELTTLSLTAAQYNQMKDGTITGDGKVSITALKNNSDVNADSVLNASDVAVIDTSKISAPKGTVTLSDSVVTLASGSSISGFGIELGAGQLIRFSTEAQAGATITESADSLVTGVQWLFTSVSAPVNTAKYGTVARPIDTLFVDEALLVSQPREEDLWTSLLGTTAVQKVNGDTIPSLMQYNRVNTFEAFANIAAGINYDDNAEYSTVANLTMNLEGEVNLGTILLGDTKNGNAANPNIDGKGYFQALTINSYFDPTSIPGYDASAILGVAVSKNRVGDIKLNTGSVDELTSVTINTYADADNVTGTTDGGFTDAVNVKGAVAERDGMAIDVGTITFGANTAKSATLTVTGSNNVTVKAVDISDAEINFLTIDASGHVADTVAPALSDPTLKVGNVLSGANVGGYGTIYVMDGFTAAATTDLDASPASELLALTGGVTDLTKVTAGNFGISAVGFSASSTLTLTAAQVDFVGTADALPSPVDGKADNWSSVSGTTNVLNITDLSTEALRLDYVAASGVSIGTITIKDTNAVVTLASTTNLGGATSIVVPEGTTLALTAAQFEQLAGKGTITGLGTVNILNLNDAQGSIDLSLVTAKNGTITLDTDTVANGGTDVALTSAANLNKFSVTLDDLDGTAGFTVDNELSGQTIRFATAAQAERQIIVTGEDADAGGAWTSAGDGIAERDTNVVWMFNTIEGTANAGMVDTSKYENSLGRVWVNEQLVNGQNIERIFSSPSAVQANPTTGTVNLNSTTLVRVVNTATLTNVLPTDLQTDRSVEVEAFTSAPLGLKFSNEDKLVGVSNVTIDLGGAVTLGSINIDDVVAASVINPTGNEFGTLTINSLIANSSTHYLLPKTWTSANILPTALPAVQQVNSVGDLSSGPSRGELSAVTLNATGVGLKTGTITFTEDSATASSDSTANLVLTGGMDVEVKSVNTNDAEITALTVTTTGYTGTLTIPGASPALQMNSTQTLTFANGDVLAGTITLGNASNAGVAGNELSVINADKFDGTLNLGYLAQIDSSNDDNNGDGDVVDAGDAAFTLTTGAGLTTATLGAKGGSTPTLNAGSEWVFDYTNAAAKSVLTIDSTTVFSAGSRLTLTDVPVKISGSVNLATIGSDLSSTASFVEGLNFDATTTIEVPSGSVLTISPAQAIYLQSQTVEVFGGGTVKLVGDGSNLAALGSFLKTATVDVSGVTLIASPTTGFDTDKTFDLTGLVGSGTTAAGSNGAQTIIGSANIDAITSTGTGNDTVTGGVGNDLINLGAGDNTINVDVGTDTITGLNTGDILVVSSSATAVAATDGFVATAATSNSGTVNLTANAAASATPETIDVSLAAGSSGFNLTGRTSNVVNTVDVLIGSARGDVIDGGNTAQIAGSQDTLTGNGGNDTFKFVVGTSTPASITTATTTSGVDRELITVGADSTIAGSLKIDYTLNAGSSSSVTVAVGGSDTKATVATKIATAFAAVSGFTAIPVGDSVSINNSTGSSFKITAVANTTTDATLTKSDGTDVAQVSTVTIGAGAGVSVVAGEVYTVTLTPVEIGSVAQQFSYTAAASQTIANVLSALSTAISAAGYSTGVAGNVLTVTDGDDDNGGFTLTSSTVGGFAGSGASVSSATGANLVDVAADLITDFVSGADKIDFGLVAGSATNYAEAAQVASYSDALTAAGTALDGVVRYYLTSIADNDATVGTTDPTGLLFFDANGDGEVDGVVTLTGISSANFAFTDIGPGGP